MNKFQKIILYKKIFYSLLLLIISLSFSSLQAMDEQPEKQGQKRLRNPDPSEEQKPKKARYNTINQGVSLPFFVTNVASFCIDLWRQLPFFKVSQDSFQYLPSEVHGYIFSFVNRSDILHVQMVSKSWRAVAAKTWPSPTTLCLNGRYIGSEGALSLATGNLSALTTLYLRDNEIGSAGASGLANGNLFALTTLTLWKNSIGDAGREALKNNTKLNVRF